MKSMERVLHNGIQLDTVMKIVNAILELRIGVTNQIVQIYKAEAQMLSQLNNIKLSKKSMNQQRISSKDQYNIRSRIVSNPHFRESIALTFRFQDKKEQKSELTQVWTIRWEAVSDGTGNNETAHERSLTETNLLMESHIGTLFRLPLWTHYWGDHANRMKVKKDNMLDYRICSLNEIDQNGSWYDRRITKEKHVHGIKLWLNTFYKSQVETLKSTKSENKSILTNRLSSDSNQRKKSVYEYYDDELEVTFVSSQGQFDLGQKNMSEVPVETVCDESDQEYELIMESSEDIKLQDFRKELQGYLVHAEDIHMA